ncbi:MAG: DUF2341 domain-containing protein, partial [Candidatus Nanoarchaeia archaeon]|nr:DUF2341 domain-containing protein [Candidatus Haiyanarchaeum thermophilum]
MRVRSFLFIFLSIFTIILVQRVSLAFNYSYRISIDNTKNPNTLTNYPVRIVVDTYTLISQGKMRSDCGDIRFSTSSNDWNVATGLPYWIESGCNTLNTVIWVKVPSIPASSTTTIYMYFGDPSVTSISNGDETFSFFDDFTSSTLNTSKWNISGNHSLYYGQIHLRPNSTLTSNLTFSSSNILEFYTYVISYSGTSAYLGYFNSSSYYAYLYFYGYDCNFTVAAAGSEKKVGLGYIGDWYKWGIVQRSTSYWYLYKDYSLNNTILISSSYQPYKIHFNISNSGYIYLDWVRVRPYSYPEPSTSVNYTIRYNPAFSFCNETGSSNLCAGKPIGLFYTCKNTTGCNNSLGNPSTIPYQSTYQCINSSYNICYAYDVDNQTVCRSYLLNRCPSTYRDCGWNIGGSPCLATPPGVDGQYSAYGCNLYCCGDDPNEYRINTTIVNLTPFQNFTYSSTTDLYGCCNSTYCPYFGCACV